MPGQTFLIINTIPSGHRALRAPVCTSSSVQLLGWKQWPIPGAGYILTGVTVPTLNMAVYSQKE